MTYLINKNHLTMCAPDSFVRRILFPSHALHNEYFIRINNGY